MFVGRVVYTVKFFHISGASCRIPVGPLVREDWGRRGGEVECAAHVQPRSAPTAHRPPARPGPQVHELPDHGSQTVQIASLIITLMRTVTQTGLGAKQRAFGFKEQVVFSSK